MSDVMKEGLGLAQELTALPFKAARELFRGSAIAKRPIGEVMADTLHLAEDAVRLPWRAVDALMGEMRRPSQADLESRVAKLEREMAQQKATAENPAPVVPPVPVEVVPEPE